MTYQELQKLIFRLADAFAASDKKIKIDKGRGHYLNLAVEQVLKNYGTNKKVGW